MAWLERLQIRATHKRKASMMKQKRGEEIESREKMRRDGEVTGISTPEAQLKLHCMQSVLTRTVACFIDIAWRMRLAIGSG